MDDSHAIKPSGTLIACEIDGCCRDNCVCVRVNRIFGALI